MKAAPPTTAYPLRSNGLLHRVLLGCLVVVFFAVPLPNLAHYAWDYDEGPQLQAARLASDGSRLYRDISMNKPPLLTWYLQTAMRMFGDSVWVSRYAVLLVNLVGFVLLGALGRLWYGRWGDVGAMVLVLLPGELTVRAGVVMNDLPAVSLGLFALWAGTMYRLRHAYGWLMLSAIGYASMLLVHPMLMVLVLPLALIQLTRHGRLFDRLRLRSMANQILLFGLIVSLVLVVVCLQVDWVGFRYWVLDYNARPIDPTLDGDNNHPGQFVAEYFGMHGWLVAAAVVGGGILLRSRHSRFWSITAVLWVAAICLTLLLSSPLRPHYRMFLLYPLALLGGGGLGRAIRWMLQDGDWSGHASRLDRVLFVVVSVTLVGALHFENPLDMDWPVAPAGAEAATTAIQEITEQTGFVVTDDPFLIFAAGRRVPPDLADTSYKRGLTGLLTSGTVICNVIDHRAPLLVSAKGRLDALPAFGAARDAVTHKVACFGIYCLYEPQEFDPVDFLVGDSIALSAYRVSSEQVQPGSTMTVTLLWRARRFVDGSLSVFVHLVSQDGQMVTQHDGPPMSGLLPTALWLPGDLVPDVHPIQVPDDAPQGSYVLHVGMYDWPSLVRLPVADADGVSLADEIIPLVALTVADQ